MFPTNGLLFPKLRIVDVRPFTQGGYPYYLLRDPLSLSEGSLLVPQYLGPVLALCDGTLENTQALAAAIADRYGPTIDVSLIDELLAALDTALLLENDRAARALTEKIESYRRLPFRSPSMAGLSYPAEREALARLLNDYVMQTGGSRAARPTSQLNGHRDKHRNGDVRQATYKGIFSPHIDYHRGGIVYAHAWKAVEETVQDADLAILIGTDHYGDDLFTLTRQSYATPYGTLPTATEIVDDLARVLGENAVYRGELRHSNEHSLELVTVWLQHMRGSRPLEVVPVLCGSLSDFYSNGKSPATYKPIQAFVETLDRHSVGRNVFVVASGDLSHVGPAFGGSPLTHPDRSAVHKADRTLIEYLCLGDAEGFFDSIRSVHNRYNVCGTTPGYLALRLMGDVYGQEMGYQSCPADEKNTSAVTITGISYD